MENINRELIRLIRFYVNFISRFSNLFVLFPFVYKLFDKKEKNLVHIFNINFTIYARKTDGRSNPYSTGGSASAKHIGLNWSGGSGA